MSLSYIAEPRVFLVNLNLQVEYLPQQGLHLGGIHVQIDTDDFVIQPVQFGNFLHQLQEYGSSLAARINALQVAAQQIVVRVL